VGAGLVDVDLECTGILIRRLHFPLPCAPPPHAKPRPQAPPSASQPPGVMPRAHSPVAVSAVRANNVTHKASGASPFTMAP